jgi:hypothetical protein
MPEYIVTFSYKAGTVTCFGKYRAHSSHSRGKSIDILYDPNSPNKNTLSDFSLSIWHYIIVWGLGGGLGALLAWLKYR